MITGANISAGGSGCLRSDQRGLTPNCKNGDLRKDLRDYDRGDFVGDNGLGLVVVDVDRLKGAHAKRLPAVGHSVDMDTLERRRYRNGLRCGAGSCTHAPQAAVNDMAVGSETGSKDPHTHMQAGVTLSGGDTAQKHVWIFIQRRSHEFTFSWKRFILIQDKCQTTRSSYRKAGKSGLQSNSVQRKSKYILMDNNSMSTCA